MINRDDYILRPIKDDDVTKKLSLGNSTSSTLKNFLRKKAYEFHQFEIAKTFALLNKKEDTPIIRGYMTLMNSEILLCEDQRSQESSATSRYKAFPAVKIARLAIDKSLQGNGFGTQLLDWCINHIKLVIMLHVGCRDLIADSKSKIRSPLMRGQVLFY